MSRDRKDPKKHLCITVPGRRIIECSKPEVSSPPFRASVCNQSSCLLTVFGAVQYLEYIQKTNFQNYVKVGVSEARCSSSALLRSSFKADPLCSLTGRQLLR